ncbi:MAG: hypothetical protein IJC15_00780 [Clostridia bacterium]|nr:hypothetical protein [Clostridia bacterium]
MNEQGVSLAWRQYEAGRDYKRRLGLYTRIRENERFWRGEQWQGEATDLPRPVFNVIRRVMEHLICSIVAGPVAISYSHEALPGAERGEAEAIRAGIAAMSAGAARRWARCRMDRLVRQAMVDAAISGDGVFYAYWDADAETGQAWRGDIATVCVDSVNLFVADMNCADIQSQAYVMLAGRARVEALRAEAMAAGMTAEEAYAMIIPDHETETQAGDMAAIELDGEEKATFLIKFRREGGEVVFEKSVRGGVIRCGRTGCRRYPVAYFSWNGVKNSFHGDSPITAMIPNQKFLNRAYAMAMKHMADTAFSKVIYDKSKIPEWSNGVGEAIAAVGGNVADAVSVVGVGQMQEGYLDLIENAMRVTKELAGAPDAALGTVDPNNTSAILALQEAAAISQEQVRSALYGCVEELALIWADMVCAYYPEGRLLPIEVGGETAYAAVDYAALRRALIAARVEVGEGGRYAAAATVALLGQLLDKGHISFVEYLERLPAHLLLDRQALLERRKEDGERGDGGAAGE